MSTEWTLAKKNGTEFFVDETSCLFSLYMHDSDIPGVPTISIHDLTLDEFKAVAQRMLEIASYYE